MTFDMHCALRVVNLEQEPIISVLELFLVDGENCVIMLINEIVLDL